MSKEIKLIPELRFPEFVKDGKWVEKRLGEIGDPLMCKRIFKEETTVDPKNGVPFYKIGTFGGEMDAYIPIELYNDYRGKYSFPNKGDILISAAGTIGRLVVYDGLPAYFQDSNIVWIDNDEELVQNSFLYYCYTILTWQTSDGGVVRRLYNSDLRGIQIFFPKNKEEQQKIAACLSSLDDLIEAENQKLKALKDHKKGLMQQMFPAEGEKVPKLRLPEFEDSGEWEENQLNDLCHNISSGKDKNQDNGDFDLYGSTGIIGRTENASYEGDYILVARVGANAGLLNRAIGQFGVTDNTLVINLKEPEMVDFIFFSLDKIGLNKLVFGSGQPLVTGMQLKELNIPIPINPKEQQKIASCLSSLDGLITTQRERIEALKLHKKGLMQGLFPSNTK